MTNQQENKYWVLFAETYSDGAVLSTVPGDGPKSYKYDKAIPLLAEFPTIEDAVMCFDPNYPDRLKLYDVQKCLENVLVVNGKVKAFFESQGITEEFLQVRLWDHEDNTISEDYYIFNCLETVRIFDVEKSDVVFDSFFPDRIQYVNKMVTRKDIETDAKVFRASRMKDQLFISDDFKQALEASGIVGFKVRATEEWSGI